MPSDVTASRHMPVWETVRGNPFNVTVDVRMKVHRLARVRPEHAGAERLTTRRPRELASPRGADSAPRVSRRP